MSKLLSSTILLTIITLSGCSLSNSTYNSEHLNKSINYSNEAAAINNRQGTNISQQDFIQIIKLKKQALDEAKLVNIDELNSHYSEFGNKWKEKYINGLTLFIEGVEERSNQKSLQGQVLLDEWDNWYAANIDGIKNK